MSSEVEVELGPGDPDRFGHLDDADLRALGGLPDVDGRRAAVVWEQQRRLWEPPEREAD